MGNGNTPYLSSEVLSGVGFETGVSDDPEQPLHQYILDAKEANDKLYEQEKSSAPYLTANWHFIRLLRGRREFEGFDADAAFDLICEELKRQYPGRDPLTYLLGWSDEDHLEFLTSWHKVRFAGNHDPLEYAFQLAMKRPIVPDRCKDGSLEGYRLFVSFAAYLQVIIGVDQNILLPCKTVGYKIDVDPATVSRHRQLAVDDGYLEEKKPYRRPGDSGSGRATEFRFRVDLFQELVEFEFDPDEILDDPVDRW